MGSSSCDTIYLIITVRMIEEENGHTRKNQKMNKTREIASLIASSK